MNEKTILIQLTEADSWHTGRPKTLSDVLNVVFKGINIETILQNQKKSIETLLKHFYLEYFIDVEKYELLEMPYGLLMRPK